MSHWITALYGYIWDAIRTHPFNALTLVIAGAAFWVSVRALDATKRQASAAQQQADEARRSRELNESALAAQAEALSQQAAENTKMAQLAERSAAASEASATTAKLSLAFGQRPWISIGELDIQRRTSRQVPLLVVVNLINDGNSPALELVAVHRMRVSGAPPDTAALLDQNMTSQGNVGPGRHVEMIAALQEDPTVLNQIADGRSTLYLFGQVRYKDVFGDTHETRWGFKYFEITQRFAAVPGMHATS